ncbi:hypothetical protein GF312_17355 [Candidatus Poribacteria bacterium]|nr:hypothetical protein [Candidatus Poribacteria bacterium]
MSVNSKQESGNSMLSRKLKYGTSSVIIVLIVLGIIAVINFLSTRHFVRADLTENKDFTISDSTKKVLGELDDVVNITAYFSKNLPPYLTNIQTQVKDILDEYEAYAHGNLEVNFVDPAGDPSMEQKLRFMGIPQAQLNIIEKDKAEVVNVYFGMAVMYEDRKEVIPVIQNVMTLEYDLTSAIVKVKRSEEKTLCFLTGHGEYSAENYEAVRTSLGKQYMIMDVDLSEGKSVPNNVNTLIVAGPKEKISEREKYEIDQFLMRGGKIIFLIDSVDLAPRSLMATEVNTNLNDMLENYGVSVGKSLVLDRASNSNASFSSGFVQYSMPYPFWPRITKRQFDQSSPMVNQLENLILPWSAPVELLPSKVNIEKTPKQGENQKQEVTEKPPVTQNLKGIELFHTSQYSWTKGRPFNISPQQRFVPTGDMKSYPLAVAVTGKFDSLYADKPVPEPEMPEGEETQPEPASGETLIESPETQIVVVGNARFIANDFLGRSRANMLFIENAVDWMTLGEDLINIRSRFVTDRPIKEISENAKLFVRIINICGAALLVIAFGLVRFIFKRRAKKVYEAYSV